MLVAVGLAMPCDDLAAEAAKAEHRQVEACQNQVTTMHLRDQTDELAALVVSWTNLGET